MPYYPKSQIQTDLYTKGEELRVYSTKANYIGYYWKTSKGEYFSGKNPYDGTPLELETYPLLSKSTFNTITYNKKDSVYNILKKIDVTQTALVPPYIKPFPTQKDYEIGNFIRYFAKKNNENIYIETSKEIYNELNVKNANYDFKSYFIFSLQWKLTGNKSKVISTNQNIVLLTEGNNNIKGLGTYLKNNYLEFYK
tara:strand:+ start:17046 stop:17633 length:588 start_codon:yes stop_codon:yes gene_type:complete